MTAADLTPTEIAAFIAGTSHGNVFAIAVAGAASRW
jgi:hypothetical protein